MLLESSKKHEPQLKNYRMQFRPILIHYNKQLIILTNS
jgi:hypothetical protein